MIFLHGQADPGYVKIVMDSGEAYHVSKSKIENGFIYDTQVLTSAILAASGHLDFNFTTLTGNDLDQRVLAADDAMIVTRVGVYVPKTFGACCAGGVFSLGDDNPVVPQQIIADEVVALENGVLQVLRKTTKMIEGPAVNFPASCGVTGSIGGAQAVESDGETEAVGISSSLIYGSLHNGTPAYKDHADWFTEFRVANDTNNAPSAILSFPSRAAYLSACGLAAIATDAYVTAQSPVGIAIRVVLYGLIIRA